MLIPASRGAAALGRSSYPIRVSAATQLRTAPNFDVTSAFVLDEE
jgi:hypothetical protein